MVKRGTQRNFEETKGSESIYWESVITLLGRIAFKPEQIRDIVRKGKRNPIAYINVYNACDGNHTVTQLAKIAGVSQPAMTTVLKQWVQQVIIYDVQRPGGKFYKKLYPI